MIEIELKGPPQTTAQIDVLAPTDPVGRQKFVNALELLAQAYHVDGPEPARNGVVSEAAFKLVSVGLDQFDEDGTNYAEALADAYFAARANVVARSSTTMGNA